MSYLNRCIWNSNTRGEGNFVVGPVDTGYLTPGDAGAQDQHFYNYFAQSADMSQWEVVRDALWDAASNTLIRSAGVVELSSNGGSLVVFSTFPKVYMGVPLAADLTLPPLNVSVTGDLFP